MALDMGITVTAAAAQVSDNIFASTKETSEIDIIIVSGQGALVRGQELGKVTASGKYAIYNPGASDGTETLSAILGADVDATSADQATFAYVIGEFNASALTGDYTAYTGIYGSGLIIKEGDD
jgi:hypothetical protein